MIPKVNSGTPFLGLAGTIFVEVTLRASAEARLGHKMEPSMSRLTFEDILCLISRSVYRGLLVLKRTLLTKSRGLFTRRFFTQRASKVYKKLVLSESSVTISALWDATKIFSRL